MYRESLRRINDIAELSRSWLSPLPLASHVVRDALLRRGAARPDGPHGAAHRRGGRSRRHLRPRRRGHGAGDRPSLDALRAAVDEENLHRRPGGGLASIPSRAARGGGSGHFSWASERTSMRGPPRSRPIPPRRHSVRRRRAGHTTRTVAGRWPSACAPVAGADAEAVSGLAEALRHLEHARPFWERVPDAPALAGVLLDAVLRARPSSPTSRATRRAQHNSRAERSRRSAMPMQPRPGCSTSDSGHTSSSRAGEAGLQARSSVPWTPVLREPPSPERACGCSVRSGTRSPSARLGELFQFARRRSPS